MPDLPPATPTTPTSASPPPGGRVPTWTVRRILALVCGSLLVVGTIGVGALGGAAAYADHAVRDRDGYLTSGTTHLAAHTYAITSTALVAHGDMPSVLLPHSVIGDLRVTAAGSHQPVFIGIAATSDVERYLAGVQRAAVTEFANEPVYRDSEGRAPSAPPTSTHIWVAQSSGPGAQQVIWPARNGDWTLVVMNADGSSGISTGLAVGATLPALGWLVPTLLGTAGLGLGAGTVLLVVALRRPRTATAR